MIFYHKIRGFDSSEGFLRKVTYLCGLMKVPEDWLILVMHSESDLKTTAVNSASGATGLIQFMPETARDLGTTVEALYRMTHDQQMDYVIKYFSWPHLRKYWGKMKSVSDLYLLVFYPYAIGKPNNYVFGSEVNNRRVQVVYKQNSAMYVSRDGVLTRADFLEWFYQRYKRFEKDGIYFERAKAEDYKEVYVGGRRAAQKKFKPIEYEELTITSEDLTDVQKVIDEYQINMSAQELLDYKDNNKAIFAAYRKDDKAPVGNGGKGYKKAVVELVRPTVKIKIPLGKYTKNHLFKKTQFQEHKNVEAYIDQYVKDILTNPNYVQLGDDTVDAMSKIFKQQDNISVYVWCKSLGEHGRLIDATLFVESVRIFQGKNGGNFSVTFAPVTCDYNIFDGWHIPASAFEEYIDEYGHRVMLSRNSLHDIVSNRNAQGMERTRQFFHTVIQSNDIVFIRFKNLKMEASFLDKYRDVGDIYMDVNELPGKVYDMIGLVDKNSENFSASDSSRGTSISGRDLTKTIIDDGSYFFPISFTQDQTKSYFQNVSDDNGGVRRIQGTGAAEYNDIFDAYGNNAIGDILQFILTQEANIQVCPDDVFDAYPEHEKTTIVYNKRNPNGTSSSESQIQKAPGIWQICKIAIDPKIGHRLISNHTIGSEQGSLLNHIRYVCQEPFVEFFTDTYGDKFYFIARIPPFDYEGFKSGAQRAMENPAFHIPDHDIIDDQLEFNDHNIPTWFRLTPQSNYFGDNNTMALTYLQAVFLPEYVEIWGSRAMDITTHYITFDSNNKGEEDHKSTMDYMVKQSQADLEYLVETNAYLPFTRQGKLTIRNNRAIKRGHFIYLPQTDEVGYVEDVAHSWSINLSQKTCHTILTLTRLMKRKYFDHYFKIVNLEKNKGIKINNVNESFNKDYEAPLTITFEKNGVYFLHDQKLDSELELIKSDYNFDDLEDFRTYCYEANRTSEANVQYLVRLFSDKMNITGEVIASVTELDDPNHPNLQDILKSRAILVKNKIVEGVRSKTGRDIASKLKTSVGMTDLNDYSTGYESRVKITAQEPNRATNTDTTHFKVNREVFDFFVKRKQFS